jgi:hypothetical protein
LHKLDQLHLDVIIAERFPDYGLGRTINDRLKGQQQNKITSKQQLSNHELRLLLENITNPALFFIRYHRCSSKSDLEIPENSSKFISLYLLSRSVSRRTRIVA